MECPACHRPNQEGTRFCAHCGALLPLVATNEADPLLGTIVGGRFRITGVLGEGGMGRVYTAEQPMGTSVRKVAVKTLLSQYAKDPQVLARFMRECGTVSELEHPNTIRFYDFGQTLTGELYIAMELLTGKSLETELLKGPISPDRVDRIVYQICGSLEEAHQKGIVHRDLKPANIFLTPRGGEEDYVKVLDFGIAKKDDRDTKHEQKLTQQGTVLGTPPYMSPEQFKGLALDARSDIYSLGIMVYEMLTGKLPFEADTPWAWATAHITQQPTPFEANPNAMSIPEKMRYAVLRALSKDQNERPATVRHFYEELSIGAPKPSPLSTSGATAPPTDQGYAAGKTQVGTPVFGTNAMAPTMDQPAYPTAPSATPGSVGATANSGPTKKGNMGLILAAALGISALVVGAVVLFKGRGGAEASSADQTIPVPTGPTELPSADAAPSPTETTIPVTTPPTGPTSVGTQKPPAPTTTGASVPTPTATASAAAAAGNEGACNAAMGQAQRDNVDLAIKFYRECSGPKQAQAKSAINASALREAREKGCAAMPTAKKAAAIGAGSALAQLNRKCK